MSASRNLVTSIGLLLLTACGLLTGCQKSNSGADIVPTVTIKPSTAVAAPGAEGEAPAADGEETASTDVAPAASAGGEGSLKGQVVIDGAFTPLPALYSAGAEIKDKSVCAAMNIPNEQVIASGTGGLANVFIYLEKAPKGASIPAVPAEPAIFDQKGCVFLPHTLLMRAEQTINVLNGDGVAHNTHTYPTRSSGFNSLVAANDRAGIPMKYAKPEKIPVQVKCDIHPWMVAYHLPLDHSFAAVTDAEGNFEIAGLPAGNHEFKVWHEKIGYVERAYKVTISGGAPTEVKITVGAAKLASFDGDQPKVVNISR
ncbi:MAG: hypothetical protein ACKVT0_02765 [Planctomycetaceae bacterium]